MIYRIPLLSVLLSLLWSSLGAQSESNAYRFSGLVYDEHFNPLPYTHVLASGTGEGDVTDSLGIFIIYIRDTDRLSFYNLGFLDTAVFVSKDQDVFYIKLKPRIYNLQEARVFSWGSSYSEFMEEVNNLGVPEKMGEELGLPTQTPGVIQFDMDEKKIKSASFLFSSPISFLYYNFSKYEKSARKAFKLDQDQELIDLFNKILAAENINSITGLEGEALENFLIYLNANLNCTYRCSEMQLITEIYAIWKTYKESGAL